MDHAIARAAPEVSITISPDLRRLRRGGGATGTIPDPPAIPDEPHAAPPPAAAPSPESGDTGAAEAMRAFPHNARPISLRRDGGRPLRFLGLPLLRCQTLTRLPDCGQSGHPGDAEPSEAIQRLDVYMDRDGALVVATSVDFRGTVPARPLYRAARVLDPSDLAAFVTGHAAEDGLLWHGEAHGAPGARAEMVRSLDAAFRAMLRDSGLSIPAFEEDMSG